MAARAWLGLLLAGCLGLAFIGVSRTASASSPSQQDIHCSFSSGDANLAINVLHWGQATLFKLTRNGGELVVRELKRDQPPVTVPCNGSQPTVTNTDRIVIRQARRLGDFSASRFMLDMKTGAFAPGMTPESGKSETEVDLRLHRSGIIVAAPPGMNRVSAGLKKGEPALDMNDDGDFDIRVGHPFAEDIALGPGDDFANLKRPLTGVKPDKPSIVVRGGAGDDRLISGQSHQELVGGGGGDTLWAIGAHTGTLLYGGAGADTLIGGPKRNVLLANAGNDRIDARNGTRDWVDCGPGSDQLTKDPKEEHVSRCDGSGSR